MGKFQLKRRACPFCESTINQLETKIEKIQAIIDKQKEMGYINTQYWQAMHEINEVLKS